MFFYDVDELEEAPQAASPSYSILLDGKWNFWDNGGARA